MSGLVIAEKFVWLGVAAIGFGVLFNVPKRSLFAIFVIAGLGGLTKLLLMETGLSILVGTLAGAILIGIMSIPLAHRIHVPPPIFSIPAIIPMVPGVFAYRVMIGLVKMAGNVEPDVFSKVLNETVNNGLKVMLILMSLAGGVALPMLLTRKESAKNLHFLKRKYSHEEGEEFD